MSGNAALGLLVAGALLLAVECNRPGRVIPGAAGLLLVLLAMHRLSLLPESGTFLWLAGTGAALVASQWWRPMGGVPGAVGSATVAWAMWRLGAESGGQLRASWAGICGALLGGGCSALLLLAGHARRAKRNEHRTARTGAGEHWGVD